MHVDEAALATLRGRYGDPAPLAWDGEVGEQEFVLAGFNPRRRHDFTFFVFNGDRLALIEKPQYPPGIWRPPGGGVRTGEDLVEGIRREALEELGVEIELERYLVETEARFRFGGETIEWRTHVVSARTDDEELAPQDTDEISGARWERSTSSAARCASASSAPGARCGATASPCTTPRRPHSPRPPGPSPGSDPSRVAKRHGCCCASPRLALRPSERCMLSAAWEVSRTTLSRGQTPDMSALLSRCAVATGFPQ